MQRTKVFVSYSHADGTWLAAFATHVAVLRRRGLIDLWSDTRIEPGAEWEREVEDAAIVTESATVVKLRGPGLGAQRVVRGGRCDRGAS